MSSTREIELLDDRLHWFVRTPTCRLFDVVVAADVRSAVLRLVVAQELHAQNVAPFYAFEDACTKADDGFAARTERVALLHAHRSARVAEELGTPLSPLELPPPQMPPIARFVESLARAMRAHLPWNRGMVVVLAPTVVDDGEAWDAALAGLIAAPALAEVRWVTVHTDASPLVGLRERLGPAATLSSCALDQDALARELDLRLELMAAAAPGAPGPARAGCAWPRGVMPPPRPGASVPPATVDPDAELPRRVLAGATALRKGDTLAAIQAQAAARDVAVRSQPPRIAVLMELLLGSYLVVATRKDTARAVYRQAIERARRSEQLDLAAQGCLAVAAIELSDAKHQPATLAYIEAGELAERSGANALALEAFRMAGTVRANAGDDVQAASLWRRALQLTPTMGEAELGKSSAAETARALAALLRRRGLAAEAEVVSGDAERFASAGGAA